MKKRMIGLFLALALCLSLLPAAAFAANGASETSTPHTHYLCGEDNCTGGGNHAKTDKITLATAITQDNDGYVRVGNEKHDADYWCTLSTGTYYLATNLVLEHPITIEGDITICLSGNSITINANENAFEVISTGSTASSTLTLTDCKNSGQITHGTTTGGTKYLGNGVSLHQSCNFIMYGGSITGNTITGDSASLKSGGVWVQDNSTFTMYGGSITGNTTVWSGGGVYVEGSGTFHMCGGTIGGNSATDGGGGVYVGSGSIFTMAGDSSITGNTAGSGGGVEIFGSMTMTGGSITGNNAGNGGGVYVGSDGYGNSVLTLSGAVQIKDNVCNGTKGSNGNYTGGTTSNVYLRSGRTITIGSNHLSSTASIGVTTQTTPTGANSVAIATDANLADKQYFHSDAGENYLFYVTSGGTICMTAANAHGHPICGASCSHNGSGHASDETTWQPIGSAGELAAIPSSGGYYYLTDDVTLNSKSVWAPPSGTFLCLNGHTITGAAGKDTIVVGSGVNFTLTDCKGSGKITHENIDAAGCGVNVVGSFTMYGGSITGNHNPDGGGVMVENTGSFTMYGGSITGNSVSGSGGGVDVRGTMIVSGSVRIAGNVKSGLKSDSGSYTGGTTSNVYLRSGRIITIGSGHLANGASIGVTTQTTPTNEGIAIATGASNYTVTDTDKAAFFSDEEGYLLIQVNNELKLKRPHTHSWTYALSTTTTGSATITATCKNCAENNNTDFCGGSVTIEKPKHSIYGDGETPAATYIESTWQGGNMSAVTYRVKKSENNWEDLNAAPTDAGTYTAGITVGEGDGAVTASVEYTIVPKELTDPTIEIASGSVYDGNVKTPNVTVKDGNTTIPASEYTVSYSNNINAGENTATVTITDNANGNYTVSGSAKFTIAKADSACTAPTAITGLTYTGEAQPLINAGTTADGTMVYSLSETGDYSADIPTGTNADTYTVWYKVKGDNNHNDSRPASVSVTIDKQPVTIPKADPTQFTYSGEEQTYTVAASDLYTVSGNVRKNAGTHTVTVTLRDTENYIWSDNTDAAKTFDFVIGKAQVIVTVKDKSAYVGSTAPDLSKPELDKDYTVSGLIGDDQLTTAPTLAYDPSTPDMSKTGEAAKIVASGASAGENYEITYVDGKLTLSVRPVTDPTTTKTETTTNPDGSVTKTETKSDGTVTETTTNKDGSTTKTETKPDGSSKTEVKDASGSTGTVNTGKDGQTTAEAKISDKAISDAKKSDEAVKIPAEITPGEDSASAPTVKIDLPTNAGETKIEIPVKDITPGTVAVIVKPDGTEEIVKDSVPTENGIQLTVSGDVTVKIVNNAKDFTDTKGHWAQDSVDFASARGLVNGTSESTFAPDAATTRAQLWTILARQANADLTGGANWYEKAQNWAKTSGISDGTDPNGTITRAQMVTMLYRAVGSPEVSGASSFTDVPADSYYAKAVAWAVENGITAGVGDGKFDPDGTCTRAQIATCLYRLYLSR